MRLSEERKINFREELENIFKKNNDNWISDSELYDYIKNILKPYKKEIPVLYRYVPADYNNIRNLETKKLYLSEVGNMNDIFEGLSCEITDKVIDNLDIFGEIACLKSFSENKNDLLMWSTYGDNYSGMCLEYELRNINDDYIYHLFPIVYKNERTTKGKLDRSIEELASLYDAYKTGSIPDEIYFLKDIMALFLSKSKSWEYEREWRLVVTALQLNETYEDIFENQDEHEEFYRINKQIIDFDYIKRVYLGPKMKSNIKEHIKEICKELGIEAFETRISKDKYEIEIYND